MDDSAVIPSVPPGFVPLTSFTLQRIQDDDMASAHPDPLQIQMDMDCSIISTEKFKKSLRHRPWVNYKQFDDSSEEEEPDFEPFAQGVPSIHCLPKGVIRGCNHCSNCQKVTARWRSEDACRPVLDEAPVFYPTEEEFKDTLKYIASIRSRAELYGICRIVPPPSWAPPCPLKEKDVWEHSEFVTRTQHVHKLQNRGPVKELSRNHSIMKTKRRKLVKMGSESTNCNESIVGKGELGSYKNAERFGFEPGPEFTLNSFQKYADDFKEQYFQIENMDADLSSRQWEPTVENIEGEYWRIIERPTEEIEVLYGADLETGVFGSGFPKKSSAPLDSDLYNHYANSGWNLNNLPRLPGSVLSFESGDISGVLVPWLYIGMCFSSFCWHVEDHHLYSLNYLHWGAPKLWYGVPAREALKLEGAMKKHLAELFEEQPDLLHNLVTQFSPSILKSEGVPVYRCVQHSGEFILTFPRAYHSGFNCGFNCAEAVNVAPIDWLPHGQNAVELYREQGRKISISHDKLLLGAARETVRAQWNIRFLKMDTSTNSIWKDISGTDGILAMALKARIEMDRVRRDFLCASSQSRKMEASFDSNCERECAICHYDLHLSAAGCPCSPEKFACLIHAKQICSCPWQKRFFLFRYEISEMNVLVDAVGGKLSAVHRWAISDLGLSLSSYVKKDKGLESKNSSEGPKRENEPISQDSSTSGGRSCSLFQETKSCSLEVSKEPEKIVVNAAGSSCSITDHPMHQQSNRMAKSVSKVPCAEGSSLCGNIDNQGSYSKKGQKSLDFSLSSVPGHQPSQEGSLVSKVDKGLSSNSRDVIVLSEDKCQSAHELLPHKPKVEAFAENPEAFARLKNSDDKVTSCNSHQDRVLIPPETNACLLSDGDIDLQFVMGKTGSLPNLVPTKVGDQENEMTCKVDLSILPDRQLSRSFPQGTSSMMKSSDIPVEKSAAEFSLKEGNDCSIRKNENNLQNLQLCGTGTSNDEGKDRKIEPDSDYNLVDRGKSNTKSSPHTSHSLRPQKGPRMAKVVRRFNSNVEPLEYGVVLSGKLWSTSQAIFPKGYRSRVRYFSITDPTQMCYYVSEILDAGLLGPLFMVAFEPCPSEVFIHVSATKCWDMVRERVNNGIRKQHSLGKTNLPSLQPPGSLDGLEMYGLSSPKIIQAIEGIDRNHVCTEYWKSQPISSRHVVIEETDQGGTDALLSGLFKKGNLEELRMLHSTLRSDVPETKQEVIQLLTKEIESRSIT